MLIAAHQQALNSTVELFYLTFLCWKKQISTASMTRCFPSVFNVLLYVGLIINLVILFRGD